MNNYFNHFSDGNPQVKNKFLCEFFICCLPENSHLKEGQYYSHFIDGKYETFAKVININFKYLDIFPAHIAYLCFGLNQKDAQEYIIKRYSRTQNYARVNFKDKRIAVLTFQKCEPPKSEQTNLKL